MLPTLRPRPSPHGPLRRIASRNPVVTLTGPRQSGKTTLARTVFPHLPYVSLEDPDTRRYATEDPRGFLAAHASGAVLDEIQRAPELPSCLQAIVDADPAPGRFVLTGGQQFELMTRVSQSLAGRTSIARLLPFTAAEALRANPRAVDGGLPRVLLTGFHPRIHDRGLDPAQALGDYFTTYVERDLRHRDAMGNEVDLLLPWGRQFHGIEVKAGATVNPDYFRGLESFDRAFPGMLAGGGVVTGGDRGEVRWRWQVWPWRRLAQGRGASLVEKSRT